jgi:hypothetical protein
VEKTKDTFAKMTSVMALIIAIGGMIWAQAKTTSMVENTATRLTRVEQGGSEALRSHMAGEAAERIALAKRIEAVRDENTERIRNITGLLEKLIENQGRLMDQETRLAATLDAWQSKIK